MATKSKKDEAQGAQVQAATAPEQMAPEQPSQVQNQTTSTPEAEAKLESLSVLAARHRVPSWEQAALCRFMGWADGKMLTDDEYTSALSKLAARHLGGGRRK
ncbi:MAG: hypothetical protein J1E80_06510 [Desulfovibrionaceae bacterium]|nr:hypothetical protein [Desulfovibrionaceae bacterium]